MPSYAKNTRQESLSIGARLEETFASLWWVVLFILGCYLCYEQGLIRKDRDFKLLQSHYQSLIKQREILSAQHDSLVRQINSQSDPAYVELTLMKGLGLVPEGQTKVLFTDDDALLRKSLKSGG